MLNFDYIITKVQLDVTSVTGVEGGNSGIIRVYPETSPSSATKLQITGEGLHTQKTDLEVATDAAGKVTVIVDAFDADGASPNNVWSFTGTLSVFAKPKVLIG